MRIILEKQDTGRGACLRARLPETYFIWGVWFLFELQGLVIYPTARPSLPGGNPGWGKEVREGGQRAGERTYRKGTGLACG